MKNYIKELNKKKLKDLRRSHKARQDWASLRNLAREVFEEIRKTAFEENFYEKLYIIDETDPMLGGVVNFSNFIQFYFGNSASGRISQKTNDKGEIKEIELEAIKGGALIISQLPNGTVFFSVIANCVGNELNKDNFIQSVFKNPSNVKYCHIKEAGEDFLKFIVLTSPDYTPSKFDKFQIYLITKKYKKDIFPFTRTVLTWTLRIISFAKGLM
jgi:hypothetical protein